MYLESISGRLVKIDLTPENYFGNSHFVAIKDWSLSPSSVVFVSDVVVRVWRGKEVAYRLILEWHVNLTGLVYIGDKVSDTRPI